MNERIRLLAEQAAKEKFGGVFGEMELTMIFAEKFAKLIVEDCATLVDWVLAEGGKTQGDVIREYFGEQQ